MFKLKSIYKYNIHSHMSAQMQNLFILKWYFVRRGYRTGEKYVEVSITSRLFKLTLCHCDNDTVSWLGLLLKEEEKCIYNFFF